jgi:hypothetical protein
MDICLSPARAAASRRNGAKSSGPKSPEGKVRSSQNALKHGLRAQKHMLLAGESAAEYQRLEAALMEELAPEGALQAVLARRVVAAAWRLERAETIEVQLFAWNQLDGAGRNLGLALIRDCNNARAVDTLLRYRGGTLAEFWRALKTLKALQAEQAARPPSDVRVPPPQADAARESPDLRPIKPKSHGIPADSEPAPAMNEPSQPPGGPTQTTRTPGPLPAAAPHRQSDGPPEPVTAMAHAAARRPQETGKSSFRSEQTTCAALRPGTRLTPAPG